MATKKVKEHVQENIKPTKKGYVCSFTIYAYPDGPVPLDIAGAVQDDDAPERMQELLDEFREEVARREAARRLGGEDHGK